MDDEVVKKVKAQFGLSIISPSDVCNTEPSARGFATPSNLHTNLLTKYN